MTARSVTVYPYNSLEPISRQAVSTLRVLRRIMAEYPTPRELAERLAELTRSDVQLAFGKLRQSGTLNPECSLFFETSDGALVVALELDPQLTEVLLSGLLSRKPGLAGESVMKNPLLRGALARIVVEASRIGDRPVVLAARQNTPGTQPLWSLALDATLLFDHRPYAIRVEVGVSAAARTPLSSEPGLEALGDIALRLPLLGGSCRVDRTELESLGVGDALVPGDGLWLNATLHGRLALARGDGTPCAFLEPLGDRSAKLVAAPGRYTGDSEIMASNDDETRADTVVDAVLDAPVVVQIEVATVTLPAREWANLKPGDVLATDQRLGELVALRVAGRTLAKGELVNIEGELGVRIRQILQGDEQS